MPPPLLRRAPNVLSQEVDGELLLLRTGSQDVLHLDRVASGIWRLLEEPMDEATLVRVLAEAHAVDPAVVSRDLQPALAVLREQGLLL